MRVRWIVRCRVRTNDPYRRWNVVISDDRHYGIGSSSMVGTPPLFYRGFIKARRVP